MAEEVCECKMKTKEMSVMSPERDKIWKKCLKIESGYFMNLQGNKEELGAYNTKRKACLNEIIGEYPK